jgi:tRNA pseudouridine38/39 synthase
MYEFTVTGYAFLWHQIRCMMAILFLIGAGYESPSVSRKYDTQDQKW